MLSFSILGLAVPAFVFDNGSGRVVLMNPVARTLFGLTGIDLEGITAPDLLGYEFILDASSPGHRQVALPLRGSFDVVVGAAGSASADEPPHTLVMLVASAAWSGHNPSVSPVVGWDRVAERCSGMQGELLCVAVGVVGLPAVNSDFCRSAGDYAITEFHQRLRLAGGDECVVERIGGTCFLVLLSSSGGDRLAVQRFLNVARRPIAGPHGDVVLGCAAGVSVGTSQTPLILFDRAVRNLEHALLHGAGASEWASSPCRLPTSPARLAAPLLEAVRRGEIVAAFQPVVSLLAGDVVEYEAFARWPGHESVNPPSMIALASDMGILSQFRSCVLTSAVELLQRHAGSENVRRVSINVGSNELVPTTFADEVLGVFDSAGVPPSWLQIEITDTVRETHLNPIASTIDVLRRRGVRIVLDGLREGAADWLSLIKLDIDAIKIETDILATHHGRAAAALRSVLELATGFGIDVIAKGVETIDQHERLVTAGYLFAQGHLYAAPQPSDAIDTTFATRVQGNWSQLASTNRALTLAAIGNKVRALQESASAADWLDIDRAPHMIGADSIPLPTSLASGNK